MRQACGADMAKLCPDAQPGPGRRQCMMAHKDQLSDACKSAIAAAAMAARQCGRGSPPPPPRQLSLPREAEPDTRHGQGHQFTRRRSTQGVSLRRDLRGGLPGPGRLRGLRGGHLRHLTGQGKGASGKPRAPLVLFPNRKGPSRLRASVRRPNLEISLLLFWGRFPGGSRRRTVAPRRVPGTVGDVRRAALACPGNLA